MQVFVRICHIFYILYSNPADAGNIPFFSFRCFKIILSFYEYYFCTKFVLVTQDKRSPPPHNNNNNIFFKIMLNQFQYCLIFCLLKVSKELGICIGKNLKKIYRWCTFGIYFGIRIALKYLIITPYPSNAKSVQIKLLTNFIKICSKLYKNILC